MTDLKYFTDEIPLREGKWPPVEKEAKELAGGVGRHDSQPWIAPVKTPITYPVSKNSIQTRIPLESSWNEFQRRCYPVCRHTGDQCPTKPQYAAGSSWTYSWVRSADPEGHKLPDGSVINTMAFDDEPWLDSAPIDVQAKARYTNFSNDMIAKGDLKPGEYWTKEDAKHRSAKRQKAADASQPPKPLSDSASSFQGRFCKSCLNTISEGTHGKTLYCSDRCRHRSEYIRRRGDLGVISPRVELSAFTVDRKRIGIDTDDLGFSRLLAAVS
jgi:hypothetical protein